MIRNIHSSSRTLHSSSATQAQQTSPPQTDTRPHRPLNERPPARPNVHHDDLARIFNTVMVTTQSKGKRDFSAELHELTDSAPFKAILSAVRQLSRIHGMTERQAVEQIIHTFRKMDQVWGEYVFREGLEKIKSSR